MCYTVVMKAKVRNYAINLSIVLVTTLIMLVISGGALRLAGFKPFIYHSIDRDEPAMFESDPVLGWISIPGKFFIPRYHPSGEDITLENLDHDGRRTRSEPNSAEDQLVFVGGSITQGWAISDDETFAWKIQKRYPEYDVLNFGRAGYGTYQSLLLLEQELPRLTSPKHILYGFIDHHEIRNVAPAKWMYVLMSFERRGHVDVPYATIHPMTGLTRHAPVRHPTWPLRDSLTTVFFAERVYLRIKTMRRDSQQREVAEQSMLAMNKLAKKYGATFTVIMLVAPEEMRQTIVTSSRRMISAFSIAQIV